MIHTQISTDCPSQTNGYYLGCILKQNIYKILDPHQKHSEILVDRQINIINKQNDNAQLGVQLVARQTV